jgi:hypothetical protein
MSTRVLALTVALLIALLPVSALAVDGQGEAQDDFLMRISGDLTLPAGEVAGILVGIDNVTTIDGTVENTLVLFDSTAVVRGTVSGDIIAFGGEVRLEDGARVTGDVELFDSMLTRTAGSTVVGEVSERESFTVSGWDLLVFSTLLWLSITVLVVVAALLFAAVGGRQLTEAGNLISERPLGSILAALIGGLALPFLAVLALVTVIGIPLGITILLVLMPVMLLLGHIVAGTKLGALLLHGFKRPAADDHPYLATVLGVLLLQLFFLVPFVGGLVAFVAGLLGTGALVLYALRAWRGTGGAAVPTASPPVVAPEPAV